MEEARIAAGDKESEAVAQDNKGVQEAIGTISAREQEEATGRDYSRGKRVYVTGYLNLDDCTDRRISDLRPKERSEEISNAYILARHRHTAGSGGLFRRAMKLVGCEPSAERLERR